MVCVLHPQSLPPPTGPVHRTMVRADYRGRAFGREGIGSMEKRPEGRI